MICFPLFLFFSFLYVPFFFFFFFFGGGVHGGLNGFIDLAVVLQYRIAIDLFIAGYVGI